MTETLICSTTASFLEHRNTYILSERDRRVIRNVPWLAHPTRQKSSIKMWQFGAPSHTCVAPNGYNRREGFFDAGYSRGIGKLSWAASTSPLCPTSISKRHSDTGMRCAPLNGAPPNSNRTGRPESAETEAEITQNVVLAPETCTKCAQLAPLSTN